MMQQQFFSLSPMAGQESFNTLEVRPPQNMTHTPTTSSMLAALQHDTFPTSSIDPSSSTFGTEAYGSLSYMDTSTSQDESVSTSHHSGLSFPDYVSGSGNSFDVGAFTPQDLGITTSTTPAAASEPEHDSESVKPEGTS